MSHPHRLAALALVLAALPCPAADDLTVLTPESSGGPPRGMLSRRLLAQAREALDRRRAAYEAVKTPADAAAYQQRLRREFLQNLGELPSRTPLNPRVVGAVQGDDYRMEKVLFDSQPGHTVAAVLFLPARAEPPFPVVVMPCGHTASGKTENQLAGQLLARHGIACFSYDPIGQGERSQFLDPQGQPRFRATTEHTLLGAGSIPLGRGTATYRIWDGKRAIDYVAGRKEIDAKRIGVSGCSGGGTLTSYLMALDERVACAAPSCYITSFARLLEAIGPQDAEQNVHAQLAFGMDHADYLLLRAPRPTLILAASGDFFDIQGTWDSFRQAQRFYTRLGHPERVALVETDTRHGYPRPQREAMLRWMSRWLAGRDLAGQDLGGRDNLGAEPDLAPRPAADFRCTPAGQVMRLEDARSVVDLNVELNGKLEPARRRLWSGDRAAALAEVRRLAGIRLLADIPVAKSTLAGSVARDGLTIERLVLDTEPGIRLPALLFRPKGEVRRRYLYLHGEGKHADAAAGGPLEKLAREGTLVLAVDLRGVGETGPTDDGLWGGSWYEFFTSYLLGRSMLGQRAEDLLACARLLAAEPVAGVEKGEKVDLVAVGVTVPPALHAAALEPGLIERVRLVRGVPSWSDVVRHPDAPGQLINTVHGALRAYDLPDLARCLSADRLRVEEPLDLAALARDNKAR